MIVPRNKFDILLSKLNEENIFASCIGEVVDRGVFFVNNGIKEPIESPKSDELYKALKLIFWCYIIITNSQIAWNHFSKVIYIILKEGYS